MAAEKMFRYRGVNAEAVSVSDMVLAPDRQQALQRLAQLGVVVTDIEDATPQKSALPSFGQRGVTAGERILVLRQLALMSRAGVDLLEALEIAAEGASAQAAAMLRAVAAGLRRGDRLGAAFRDGMPGYPGYVYTLIAVGDASGRLASVLDDAAKQLAFEDRVRRDITTALTYPAFLVTAGAGAVGFLFYEVVPRFAEMIGENRANLTGLAAAVINGGEFFRENFLIVALALGALAAAAAGALSRPDGRRALYDAARGAPVLRDLLIARERATWARIMGFSLNGGVGVLEASELAVSSAPHGAFRRGLQNATRSIRAGKRLDEAFGDPGLLTALDLSLLRVGQRSGALAEMFGFIGDRYEEGLRDALKRMTTLIEPIAIAFVAVAVGAVAIGLVTAMSSVYDAVL